MHASAEVAGHAHATAPEADQLEHGAADTERGTRLEHRAGAPTGLHAHCGLLPVLDPRQRAPEAVRMEPAPLSTAAVQVGRRRAAHVSVPLLLRAPKQSPPA